MKTCLTCGIALSRQNKKGYCRPHVSAAIAAERPKVEPSRCHCGKALLTQNKSGLCRKHFNEQHNANAESQAKRVAALKRRFAIDPELRDQQRERARKLHTLPQSREAKRRRYTPEFQRKGVEALRNMPEVRARAVLKMVATKLAWCPPHLRGQYRVLANMDGVTAAEARAMIEDQNELEMARWRRSIGVETGLPKFEPVEEDYTPLETAIELVAYRCKITVGKLFSEERYKAYTHPRYALAVAMKRQDYGLRGIAEAMHRSDHTTALHWVRQGEEMVARDRAFASLVDDLVACWHPVEIAA